MDVSARKMFPGKVCCKSGWQPWVSPLRVGEKRGFLEEETTKTTITKKNTSQNLLLAVSAKPLNLHELFWHRHLLSVGGCGRQPCGAGRARNALCCPWADGCACWASWPLLSQEEQQLCGCLEAQTGSARLLPLERQGGRRCSVPQTSGA